MLVCLDDHDDHDDSIPGERKTEVTRSRARNGDNEGMQQLDVRRVTDAVDEMESTSDVLRFLQRHMHSLPIDCWRIS